MASPNGKYSDVMAADAWRDIVAANGNIDPKKLAVGQQLILP